MLSGCYRILRARKVGRSTFAEIGAYEILRFLLKLYAVGSRSTVTAAIRLPPTSPREHFFFSFSYFHRGIDDDDHPELEPIVGTRGRSIDPREVSTGSLCGQKHGIPQWRWQLANAEKERKKRSTVCPLLVLGLRRFLKIRRHYHWRRLRMFLNDNGATQHNTLSWTIAGRRIRR